MARITVELPEFDSHEGVTKEYLEAAAAERGCSPDRVVNIALASMFGFEPPEDPDDIAFRKKLIENGIPQGPLSEEARNGMRLFFQQMS